MKSWFTRLVTTDWSPAMKARARAVLAARRLRRDERVEEWAARLARQVCAEVDG